MKDSHLTLRLPAELARALARLARGRGVAKSQVAREAVASYLAPATSLEGPGASRVTARQLAARWPGVPHLTPEEAGELAADLAASREGVPVPRTPWD